MGAAQEARNPEGEHVVRREPLDDLRGRDLRSAPYRVVAQQRGGTAGTPCSGRGAAARALAFCIMRSCGRTDTASR